MAGVEISVDGPVGRLEFNRPEVMNAINDEVVQELHAGLEEIERSGARVCILSGRGGKAFSAGADLDSMLDLSQARARELLSRGVRFTRSLETSSCVTIAAVNGFALGGGTEIALACDLRLASPSARFGLPEVKVGIYPGWGGIVRLPRAIPRALAMDMIISGRIVDADEALRTGLVADMAEDVEAAALAAAERVLAAGPEAQSLVRAVVQETNDLPLEAALDHALERWLPLADSAERVEGHRAFLERRKPAWLATGRTTT